MLRKKIHRKKGKQRQVVAEYISILMLMHEKNALPGVRTINILKYVQERALAQQAKASPKENPANKCNTVNPTAIYIPLHKFGFLCERVIK